MNTKQNLIINADDFGLSDGICRGIVELLDEEAVSSTTIMICSEGAEKLLKKWSNEIVGKAGVHLQLSGGNCISPANEVKSLVKRNSTEFIKRENIKSPNPAEVELEWTRQIELCADILGALPTHLDSHRGVHRIKECEDIYISLSKRFGIPVRGGLSSKINKSISKNEIKGSIELIRNWTGKNKSANDLLGYISNATERSKGVLEVVTHPGYCDEYLISKSMLNKARENDLFVLKEIKKLKLLNKINCNLIRHKDL